MAVFPETVQADIGAVSVTTVTPHTITISWSTPSSNDWCLDNPPQYQVCWKRGWALNGACNVHSSQTTANSYTITDLEPNTEYKIRVKVHSQKKGRLGGCLLWWWRDINEVKARTPEAEVITSVYTPNSADHSIDVRVENSRPSDFSIIRIGYKKAHSFWSFVSPLPLPWVLADYHRPFNEWTVSNGFRGWVDVPSVEAIDVTLAELRRCTDYRIMVYGFQGAYGYGTYLGSATTSTSGCNRCFMTFENELADYYEAITDTLSNALNAFYPRVPVADFRDVEIDSNIAYLADAMTGMLLVDVVTRESPYEISRVPIAGATRIQTQGDLAYASAGSALSIVDVSDAENPQILGNYLAETAIYDIVAFESWPQVFLALGDSGIDVVDVSDPAAPVKAGELVDVPAYAMKAINMTETPNWSVSDFNVPSGGGNLAMWCGRNFPLGDCGNGYGNNWNEKLEFSYTVPGPQVNSTVNLQCILNCDTQPDADFLRIQANIGGIWQDIAGPYDGVHNGLSVNETFSLAPGEYPDPCCNDIRIRINNFTNSSVSDEDCMRDSQGLAQVDNIRVTINGVQVDFEDFEDGMSDLWLPVQNLGMLAVASGDQGFSGYDVTDPSAPVLRWNRPTTGFANGVAVRRNVLAAVACGTDGVDIFAWAGDDFDHVANLPTTFEARDVSICGGGDMSGLLYVTGGGGGLYSVDIADPANPVLLLSDTSISAESVIAADDGTAFVAAGTSGLRIYDDPLPEDEELVMVGNHDPAGSGLYQHLAAEYPDLVELGETLEADGVNLEDVPASLDWLLNARPDIFYTWQEEPALAAAGLDLVTFLQNNNPAEYDSLSVIAESWVDVTEAPVDLDFNAFGIAWGDYDGDGDEDLYVCHGEDVANTNRLLRNDGDFQFTDVTTSTLGLLGHGSRAASWADVDNDDDLDLYVTCTEFSANSLLRNDGGGIFTDVTSGPLGNLGDAYDCDWADIDSDGLVDLYITNFGNSNQLLRNLGGCAFADITDGVTGDLGAGTGASFGDYDDDGDADLYLTRYQQANRLLRNNGGVFTDVTTSVLADGSAGHKGAAWVDYDNDGDLDLYSAGGDATDSNRLFRNEGGGMFVDATEGPLAELQQSQGMAWGDIDNDGDQDLFLAMQGSGCRLLRNEMGLFFTNTGSPIGEPLDEPGIAYAAAFSDVNLDGGLDLYVTRHDEPNRLYWGLSHEGGSWLRISLRGVTSNRAGIGARVKVIASGEQQIREIGAGAGYLAQQGLEAHFGLDGIGKVDSIVIRWPSGNVSSLTDVETDRRLVITEDGSVAVADQVLPKQYALLPVYPNPFNPSTSIRYELPLSDRVSLAIFDVQGHRVRALEQGVMRSAGTYEVSWDGRDDRGTLVASGVYFCRLRTLRVEESQRMVLLK